MGRDIKQLHPRAQQLANQLVSECAKQGLVIKITDCFRSVAEQNELYAQGRTKPGQIVTNAKGTDYQSHHMWGTAFDFCRNDGKGAYNESGNFFYKVGQIGKKLGLEWGGDWKNPVDKPHFQLPDWGSTTAKLKQQYTIPENFFKTWETSVKVQRWVNSPKGWWYQNADGTYPANQWMLINHHWYLFDQNGYMCTGWHRWDGNACDPEIGGDWYFLDNTNNGQLEGACWHTKANGAQEIWYVD